MKVSNRVFIQCINDGATLSASLRSTTSLTLMYNSDGGTVIPNWSSNHPKVYLVSRVGGEFKIPTDFTWYYNNREITFDSQTGVSSDGKFKKTTFGNGGGTESIEGVSIAVPALEILTNLASLNNTDMDVISLTGTVEVTGTNLDFHVDIPVRLTTFNGSGYFGFISGDAEVTNGTVPSSGYEGHETEDTSGYTAVLLAELINGSSPVTTFTTKWFIEGEQNPLSNRNNVLSDLNGKATTYINASEITDYVTVRCEFYVGNKKVYQAYWDVDDMQDEEEMYIRNGDNTTNNSFIRNNETAQFEFYMARRTDPYAVDSRFTNFYVKYLNALGELINMANLNTITPYAGTSGQKEWLDVTQNNLIVNNNNNVKGGRISLTYDFVKNSLGGSMTGIVMASDTNLYPTT